MYHSVTCVGTGRVTFVTCVACARYEYLLISPFVTFGRTPEVLEDILFFSYTCNGAVNFIVLIVF